VFPYETSYGAPHDRYFCFLSIYIFLSLSFYFSLFFLILVGDCCRVVAISLSVRFKSSPRELAKYLALAKPTVFQNLVLYLKNGTAYEQTGYSKEGIACGVLAN